MFDKKVFNKETKEVGDTCLKKLIEHRGWMIAKIVSLNNEEEAFNQTEIKFLTEKLKDTEDLINRYIEKLPLSKK